MASILISTQLTDPSRGSWITPSEQLEILASPIVSQRLREQVEGLDAVPKSLIDQIHRSARQSILHLVEPRPLPSNLTNWYTALKRIEALPEKILPLPLNIYEILNSQCPIGPSRKIEETHSLYLIPPGALNELEQRVRDYGQKFFQGDNPLKFRYFWDDARQEHADIPVGEPRWVLITNDVLPGSRNQHYSKQEQMITDLNAKNGTNYQVPTLRETAAALFLHKIATGRSLYQAGNNGQNGNQYTYTRVAETTYDWRLMVGGFAPSGLDITDCFDYGYEDCGVAALRKF